MLAEFNVKSKSKMLSRRHRFPHLGMLSNQYDNQDKKVKSWQI